MYLQPPSPCQRTELINHQKIPGYWGGIQFSEALSFHHISQSRTGNKHWSSVRKQKTNLHWRRRGRGEAVLLQRCWQFSEFPFDQECPLCLVGSVCHLCFVWTRCHPCFEKGCPSFDSRCRLYGSKSPPSSAPPSSFPCC